MNHHQRVVIEYLEEEIRVLKEQPEKRPRFNDQQRRRLAVKASPSAAKTCCALVSLICVLSWVFGTG
jgi:hypothetical protein